MLMTKMAPAGSRFRVMISPVPPTSVSSIIYPDCGDLHNPTIGGYHLLRTKPKKREDVMWNPTPTEPMFSPAATQRQKGAPAKHRHRSAKSALFGA